MREDTGMAETEAARRARALAEAAMHAQAAGDYPGAERLLAEAQQLDPEAVAVVLSEHDAAVAPDLAVQALRDLTRTRKQLVREKAGHVQRIDKILQAANIKLGSVLSDIS